MEELLKKILEQLEYQTKLLETITTAMDRGQKTGHMDAEKLKKQTIDMLSKIMGSHPAMEKIRQTMDKG